MSKRRKVSVSVVGHIVHNSEAIPVFIKTQFTLDGRTCTAELVAQGLAILFTGATADDGPEFKAAMDAKLASQAQLRQQANELQRQQHILVTKAHTVSKKKILSLTLLFCTRTMKKVQKTSLY